MDYHPIQGGVAILSVAMLQKLGYAPAEWVSCGLCATLPLHHVVAFLLINVDLDL